MKKFKNKIGDFYFNSQLLIDISTCLIIVLTIHILRRQNIVSFLIDDSIKDVAINIGLACVTIAGFILTILTIMVTFKNSRDEKSISESQNVSNDKTTLFYSSPLYFKSVAIMRKSVLILILVFITLFGIRIFQACFSIKELWYSVVVGTCLTILTFIRCILLLKLIITLQIGFPQKK